MNTKELMNSAVRSLNKVAFKFKKYSPEILIATGIVGTVASAVMACKATTKAGEILAETKEQMDAIHTVIESENPEYTEKDAKKDTTIVYANTAVKFAKLYGPSVVLEALSIAAIASSHNILKKRNIAIAAAYATVDKSFKDYRRRVVERFGEELDKELKYNIKAKEIEEVVKDENGEEKVTKKIVNTVDPRCTSDYTRFFDEYCEAWTKDPSLNLLFIRQVQNWANEKLQKKGYLFLNEVYEMLGVDKSPAGQCVGWIYDKNNDKGDSYVDFGIYDPNNENARLFVNGKERSILLDFNVQGDITYIFK